MATLNDLLSIKKRIYEEERIEELLEKLGCHHIKVEQRGGLYTAGLPDGDNIRSVQVKNNENLTSYIRSKGISGDIFTIVGYIKFGCKTFEEVKKKLYEIKLLTCELLGYETSSFKKTEKKKDWNWFLRPIQKERKNNIPYSIEYVNECLNENLLYEFVMYPNKYWIEEGISHSTQVEFEVGYDVATNRIIFPIRDRQGRLIGVKGRINPEIQDDRKYVYLYSCAKSFELFNYHRALPYIQDKKEVIIFESEKSVMKAWQYGYKNCLAIGGDALTPQEIAIIKGFGLETSIVLCFDKDKTVEHVKNQANQIINRMVYAVYDIHGLLDEKDSPVDKGKEVWERLYNKKYLVTGFK